MDEGLPEELDNSMLFKGDKPHPGAGMGSRLVELVDEAISTGEISRSSGALLNQLLPKIGIAEEFNPLGGESRIFFSPRTIFDALVPGGRPGLREHFEKFFEVIAYPGSKLNKDLKPGDFLIRVAFGEPQISHIAMLTSDEILPNDQLSKRGITPENISDGWYCTVVEGGARPHRVLDRFARRLSGYDGMLDSSQIIVRLRPKGKDNPAEENKGFNWPKRGVKRALEEIEDALRVRILHEIYWFSPNPAYKKTAEHIIDEVEKYQKKHGKPENWFSELSNKEKIELLQRLDIPTPGDIFGRHSSLKETIALTVQLFKGMITKLRNEGREILGTLKDIDNAKALHAAEKGESGDGNEIKKVFCHIAVSFSEFIKRYAGGLPSQTERLIRERNPSLYRLIPGYFDTKQKPTNNMIYIAEHNIGGCK